MRKVCIYFFFTSACSIFWKMCVWRYRLRPLPCPRAQNRRAFTALGQGPKDWINLFCCPEGATLSSIGFSRKLGSDSRQQWAEDQIRCFVSLHELRSHLFFFFVFSCGSIAVPLTGLAYVLQRVGWFPVDKHVFMKQCRVDEAENETYQCFFKLHPKYLRSFWDYSLDLCTKSLHDTKTYWIIKFVCVFMLIFKS